MALRPLGAIVRDRVRSGIAITSMAQCVEELVENCIDAGATCIAIRVYFSRYRIQVQYYMFEVLVKAIANVHWTYHSTATCIYHLWLLS